MARIINNVFVSEELTRAQNAAVNAIARETVANCQAARLADDEERVLKYRNRFVNKTNGLIDNEDRIIAIKAAVAYLAVVR